MVAECVSGPPGSFTGVFLPNPNPPASPNPPRKVKVTMPPMPYLLHAVRMRAGIAEVGRHQRGRRRL
jgi:hypothetical protein